jgi:hypothetical protein
LAGMAATCWQTASISGARVAMYSKKLCSAASRWLRVRMWLPRFSSRYRRKASTCSKVRSSRVRRVILHRLAAAVNASRSLMVSR